MKQDRVTDSMTTQQAVDTRVPNYTVKPDGRRIALYSAAMNLFIVVIKAGLAILTGSKAILAETIHSMTDVIGSLAVLTGIIISRKKSLRFPWGLYKVENIAAIISAFLILIAAYEIAKNVLFTETEPITNVDVSMVLLLLMVIPIFLFARYEKKEAEKINSPSLLADAQNWLTDIAPLVIVIAGLAGSVYFAQADKIAAAVVILFILKAVYGIVKDSMKSLLDASADFQTIDQIRNIVKNFREVDEITALHARNSGSFTFVHLNLRLSVTRLKDAHQISEHIEQAIKRELPFVERVITHYEPEKKDFVRFAVPIADKNGTISEHFGEAPFVALWDKSISHKRIIQQEIYENPYIHIVKGKGIRLAESLVQRGVDVLYLRNKFVHKGPEYVFSNFDVELRNTDCKDLQSLISMN